jgi:hypothetical protein
MEASNGCDHYETKGRYVNVQDDWTGEWEREWQTEEVSFIVDVDLHRYQCTRCKQIGYYSGAAKAFYETGKRAPGVQGLE